MQINRKYTFISFVLIALCFLQCTEEEVRSDFDKFTGRWSLVHIQQQDTVTQKWTDLPGNNKNRKGFIIYDGHGGMGVHHVSENYEAFEFEGKGGLDSLTKKDLRHFANNFVYFGRYQVIESNKIIEHHIESHVNPKRWYSIARRKYEFKGDTLTLLPLNTSVQFPVRIVWLKLKD